MKVRHVLTEEELQSGLSYEAVQAYEDDDLADRLFEHLMYDHAFTPLWDLDASVMATLAQMHHELHRHDDFGPIGPHKPGSY